MSAGRRSGAPLYHGLAPGPHGLSREEVARNQRARLYGATIEAVAARGWRETTVADLIALAGISRRSFYEHFASRDECLAATRDSVVARSRKLAIDAWTGERGRANRLHAACKALLDHVAAAPNQGSLVLVESLAGGRHAREAMRLEGRAFGEMLAFALDLAPRDAELRQLSSTALASGIRHVILTRLLERREHELRSLADEVLDWCEACRPRLATRVSPTSADRAEVGARPAPGAFANLDEERARAFVSLIVLILDKGYARVTDAEVAQFAGISTEAFHKRFPSKELCFLALLEQIGADATRRVRQAALAAPWPERAHVAMRTFIDHLLEHEVLTRLAFVELFQLGPAVAAHLTRPIAGVIGAATQDAPQPRHGPLIAEEALTGALWWAVSCYPLRSRRQRLPWLVDQLAFLLLASYVGPDGAAEVVEAASARGPAG
ncbi:MAG TPA: TetR/AcrR family transcriptional regulator [Solirubrobacteraceae bacterium]|jgi:AcrR family transcriptional regulator